MELRLFGSGDLMFKDCKEGFTGFLIRHPAVPDEAIPDVMSFNIIERIPHGLPVGLTELLPAESDKKG
jgi:hypothetical protein